jgi:hypothetical protein
MTRTRRTSCPGSGGGRLQRRVSARGVTCNVGSRGKLDGTRGTRGGQRGRLETRFDSVNGSFLPFTSSTATPYDTSHLHLYPSLPLPSIVCKLSEHLATLLVFESSHPETVHLRIHRAAPSTCFLHMQSVFSLPCLHINRSSYLPTNWHWRSNVPSPWMTRR